MARNTIGAVCRLLTHKQLGNVLERYGGLPEHCSTRDVVDALPGTRGKSAPLKSHRVPTQTSSWHAFARAAS